MAIQDDFSIATNGDVRWTGTSGTYTVLALHRFLQDYADNATISGNDLLDITSETPSDRSTDNIVELINGYNIDDTAAQHLYDGSIKQAGGATVYSGLVVVGSVVTGTELQVVQDNALLTSYWSTGLNAVPAANILLQIIIKTRDAGIDIDGQRLRVQARELGDKYAEFSLTAGLGNSTAAIFTSDDLNNDTAAGTIATWDQFTNTEGYQAIDIAGDGDASNEHYYSKWVVTGAGATPVAPVLSELYEYTKYVQRRATAETIHGINGELFRGITHEIDWDAGTGTYQEDEIIVWGTTMAYDTGVGHPFTIGEKLTFGTSGAVGELLMGGAGVTGEMVVAVESGTPENNETITGATSGATALVDGTTRLVDTAAVGGTALLLALDDNTGTGTLWVQQLTGGAPVDGLPLHGFTSGAEATVNIDVLSKTVSPEFLGTFTGSAVIGAFGIGLDPDDTTSSDLFFPFEGGTVSPPNNVTFTVSGLISGEDRVLVGPDAAGLDLAQDTVNGALSAGATSIVVTTAIPTDTPASGTVRVFNDVNYDRIVYSSYTGSTYTVDATAHPGGIPTAISNGANIFISYIDELATGTSATFTSVYSSPRTLFVRVRDGDTTPIKTFETTGTLGAAGGSSTAIRTTDA